ncbi:hypothetical protein AHiyo4_23490 [Arthrobacter sp. Hiyo4]|nr:hypothetical protein AHiyo4_23490 [Arthrobacter sp. Hiyo4]
MEVTEVPSAGKIDRLGTGPLAACRIRNSTPSGSASATDKSSGQQYCPELVVVMGFWRGQLRPLRDVRNGYSAPLPK